ncbi:Zinc-type alcohol dehydrogenase-like protein PB24D3.08c [Grifola frondosa]|uniref:Zinc-type alcohol dehydrogenase-like protein PB24D3.08c n=1 Tax=Grifola frondosa TaxID=5627 RepID=A0A1C7MNC2_GRIFR|nr:Zinc-type alcohol dehydrogenase-like protein PB24D3.08c [Grifola frondosa]
MATIFMAIFCRRKAFQQYYVGKAATAFRILKNEVNLPWSAYVGVCGMPGQTAYHGWKEFAHPEKGDVAFVTAGSGPVGATVIQLAKAEGLKVIASAGSDAKVAWLSSIGADVAFNYKTVPTAKVLQNEGPINIYWDNVGGQTLEAALDEAAVGARFIECGMISGYNQAPYHIKNLMLIVGKQLTISGFLVGALHHKYLEQFYREVPPKVANGEIKYKEDVKRGLEKTNEALIDVQHAYGRSIVFIIIFIVVPHRLLVKSEVPLDACHHLINVPLRWIAVIMVRFWFDREDFPRGSTSGNEEIGSVASSRAIRCQSPFRFWWAYATPFMASSPEALVAVLNDELISTIPFRDDQPGYQISWAL